MFSCAMEPHNTYQPAVMRVNQQQPDRQTEQKQAGWQAIPTQLEESCTRMEYNNIMYWR